MIGLNPDLVTLLKKNPSKISYGNVSPDTEDGGNYYIKNLSSNIDMFNKLEKWNYWGHLDNEDASSSVIPISEISTEEIYLEKIQQFFNSSYTYLQFLTDLRDALLSNSIATSTEMFEIVKSDLGSVSGVSDITDNWSEVYIDTFNGNILCTTGITDELKSTLDTRFKSSSGSSHTINSHTWVYCSANSETWLVASPAWNSAKYINTSSVDCWVSFTSNNFVYCSFEPSSGYVKSGNVTDASGGSSTNYNNLGYYGNAVARYTIDSSLFGSGYSNVNAAVVDFFNDPPTYELVWNDSGYYTDADSAYIINPSALPLVNWKGVTNKNFTEFGENYLTTDIPTEYNDLANTYNPNNPPSVIPDWLLK